MDTLMRRNKSKEIVMIFRYLLVLPFIGGVCVSVVSFAQSEGVQLEQGSELAEAVKKDQSIFSTALSSLGSKVMGSEGSEASEVSSAGEASSQSEFRVPGQGVKQIENAYEYTAWDGRNPFIAVDSLAFELGIGLEDMLPDERDDDLGGNKAVEVVNLSIENTRQPEPLEYFDVGSLVFKGQFTNIFGQPVALIAGPDNALYKATVGDRVGLSQAKVVQVNASEVVLAVGNVINRIPLSVVADF